MASHSKAGRNEPCPCGSGKKFKRCCESKKTRARAATMMMIAVGSIVIGGLVAAFSAWNDDSIAPTTRGQVWSPEHGHYH